MHATLLLADSAQALDGKLYILGGGWSIIGPDPSPMAIALKIDVPWDQANVKHPLRLELVDEDGNAFMVETPDGEQPLRIEAQLEVGRPPGTRAGTPLAAVMAINLTPLPLEPDKRYVWVLYIDNATRDEWRSRFDTRPAAGGPAPF